MPSEDIKLPFYMERVKDPREFGGIYVYIVTSSTSRGKTRESYRGGRMRLGEIEFAIISMYHDSSSYYYAPHGAVYYKEIY